MIHQAILHRCSCGAVLSRPPAWVGLPVTCEVCGSRQTLLQESRVDSTNSLLFHRCSCGAILIRPCTWAGLVTTCECCKSRQTMPPHSTVGPPEEIKIRCACGQVFTVPGACVGTRQQCPGCHAEQRVPWWSSEATEGTIDPPAAELPVPAGTGSVPQQEPVEDRELDQTTPASEPPRREAIRTPPTREREPKQTAEAREGESSPPAGRRRRWSRRRVAILVVGFIGLVVGGWYGFFRSRSDAGPDQGARLAEYGKTLGRAEHTWRVGIRDQAERMLDDCPEDLRAWEWHYLKGLCREVPQVRSLGKVQGEFATAALSRDGSRVATANGRPGGGLDVKVYDTATGVEVYSLPLEGDGLRLDDMQLNPDGRYLVLAQGSRSGQEAMLLIDVRRGKVMAAHQRPVEAVAFSPDGKQLARCSNGVEVLEAKSGELLFSLAGHPARPLALAWSPDGKTLAAAGVGRRVTLWDLVTREKKADLDVEVGGIGIQLEKAEGGIRVNQVFTDGAAAQDGRIRPGGLITAVSDVEGKMVSTAEMDTGEFAALARGRVGEGVTLRVRSLEAGGKEETYKITRKRIEVPVARLAFGPKGDRLAAWTGGSVLAWDVSTGKELLTLHGNYRPAAFTPDGRRLLVPKTRGKLSIVEVDSGRAFCVLEGFPDLVGDLAFTGEAGLTVVGKREGEFVVQAPQTPPDRATARAPDPEELQRIDKGIQELTELIRLDPENARAHRDRGRLYLEKEDYRQAKQDFERALEIDKQAQRVPPEKVGEIRCFGAGNHGMIRLALSPDGRRVLTAGSDGTARYWDIATGKEIHQLPGEGGQVYGAAISPDGAKLLTCGEDKLIHVWDAATGKELKQLKGHTNNVASVAFSPDGRQAVSAGWDITVRLWNLDSGELTSTLKGHTAAPMGAAFSPDGKRIASWAEDKMVRLWDVKDGKEVRCLEGHTEMVRAAAFSPDGRRLLSGSWSWAPDGKGSLKLWEVTTGKLLLTIGDIPGGVHGLAISADGQRALSGGRTGLVQYWDLGSGKEIIALKGHDPAKGVTDVVFLPGGLRALSVGGDATIRLWRLPDLPPRKNKP